MITNEECNALYDTNDYSVYKPIYDKINSITANSFIPRYVKKYISRRDEEQFDFANIGDTIVLKAGTKLYHTSSNDNLIGLKSHFRSKDEILYSENRIFFCTDEATLVENIRDRSGYVYEYTCTEDTIVRVDTEYGNNRNIVYLLNDKPFAVPVKKIK